MADSIQPNPFTIDPAGNVQVVGLDLPAGTSQTPPAQSRVRWIRQSDGAVVAEQLGTEYGVPTPQAQLQQLVYALSGDSSASLEMSAQQSGSPDWFTQILLLCNPNGQVAKVNAQANDDAGNTHTVTVVDSAGDSSFLQLLNGKKAKVSLGSIGGSAPANSSNDYPFSANALGFPNNVYAAAFGAIPASTWAGFRVSQAVVAVPAGATSLSMHIENTTAQNFTAYYIAIGS